MKRAVSYMRVSGLGQEDGDGFERQRTEILRYANHTGIAIAPDCWFQDTQTGKDEWEKRQGWTEMLVKAEVEGITLLLVEKLDRVARRVLVQEMILEDLKKRGITLVTSGGEDSSNEEPERVMFRQMLAVFSQYERTCIVAKMRAARQRIKARGEKCEGRKAYGFKPEERGTLAFMKACRAEGMTYDRIARELNGREEFRDTRRGAGKERLGTEWIGAVVCKILRREEKLLLRNRA